MALSGINLIQGLHFVPKGYISKIKCKVLSLITVIVIDVHNNENIDSQSLKRFI